jgi:hypothetical protein
LKTNPYFRNFHISNQQLQKTATTLRMKKTLLLIALALSGTTAFAQLPNGRSAPDCTATDINGNTHTLSEYLAAGKTVIIDISATWCGPCWNYHNTHYLDDVMSAYGPNGSDEVVVLFVEGDGETTMSDLYGTGTNTRGDWVENSNYPIINSASIANLYEISYFPTVYRICPDGIVTEIGAATASSIRSGINSNCGQLAGVPNHVKADAAAQRFCTATGDVVKAKIKNYSSGNITSASLELKENGVVVATKNFTGTLAVFSTATQSFTAIDVNPDATYTAEITSVNGGTPFDPDLTVKEVPVMVASQANTSVELHINTDDYPGEIRWEVRNSSNVLVANGGPYQEGPASDGAGGPDANTTIIENITVDANECYSVILKDAYGDGWTYGATPHGLDIYSDGVMIFSQDANFTTSLTVPAAMNTSQLGVGHHDQRIFTISPNPSTGVFNFQTTETASVEVYDITGKKVFAASAINDNGVINLSGLQKGMYFAKVKTASGEDVEKLMLQ